MSNGSGQRGSSLSERSEKGERTIMGVRIKLGLKESGHDNNFEKIFVKNEKD